MRYVEPALGLAELPEDSSTALKTRSIDPHKMIQFDTKFYVLKDGRLLINGNGYFTVLNKDLTAMDFTVNKDIDFLKVLRNGKLISKNEHRISLYEVKEKEILLYKSLDLPVKGLYEAESFNGDELIIINKGKFHFFNSKLELISSVESNYSKKRNSKLNCLLLKNDLFAFSYYRKHEDSVGLEIWDMKEKKCLREGEFEVDDNYFMEMKEFKEDYLIFNNPSIYVFNLRTFQVETVIDEEYKSLIELKGNIFIGSTGYSGNEEGYLIKFGPLMEYNSNILPAKMSQLIKMDDHRFAYTYLREITLNDLVKMGIKKED